MSSTVLSQKTMKREGVLDHGDVFKSAAHWRMRSEEMRTIADGAHDSTARAMMLRIAADYDRLAKHADRNSDAVDSMMVRMAADYDALIDCPGFMLAQDVILEPKTRKIVAVIRNGQVFRDEAEGVKIATVLGSYLYDLSGNLVGYLQGGQLIDPSTQSMPIAFRDLLKGSS